MATIREVTYEILRQHGLTTFFGNPGSNELTFLDEMPADFRYILGLHEGAVMAMADGYAQAAGGPAFVNLHSAAGTGHAIGALTNSWYSHSPLVITAGQQVRSQVGTKATLSNVDAPRLPQPLVKWSGEPLAASDVPRMVSQAIHTATTTPRGPVYVSIPLDDWRQEADVGLVSELPARRVETAGALSSAQVAQLAAVLDQARNPVLVLGPDIDATASNDLAVALAEKLRAPAWIAPSASRCPFPTRHPAFRGVLPASITGISAQLAGHDVILVVGAPVFRYHQFDPGPYLPDDASLVHLTSDPAEAARAPMGRSVVVDVQQALAALVDAITQAERPMPEPRSSLSPPADHDATTPFAPEAVFSAVAATAPADAIYVKEATSTTGVVWDHLDISRPGSYYFPAAGGLGFGLAAAVGVQLAQPERPVIALIGDGSANYGITALWTAAQYHLPVTFVILNNGTYAALRSFSNYMHVKIGRAHV